MRNVLIIGFLVIFFLNMILVKVHKNGRLWKCWFVPYGLFYFLKFKKEIHSQRRWTFYLWCFIAAYGNILFLTAFENELGRHFVGWPFLIFENWKQFPAMIFAWIFFCCFIGLSIVLVSVEDYRAAMKSGLLLYEPLKNDPFSIERIDSYKYYLKTNAFLHLSGLLKVKEQLETAFNIGIIKIKQVEWSKFFFQLGNLPLKDDKSGLKVSTVSWDDLEFLPNDHPDYRYNIPVAVAQETIYWRFKMHPLLGLVGMSGRGKTQALFAIMSAIATIDPQTMFFVIDFSKQGTGHYLLAQHPDNVDKETNSTEKAIKSKNIFIIRTVEEFIQLVEILEKELERRAELITSNYGITNLIDFEDPEVTEISNPLNPPRVLRIVTVFDELLAAQMQYGHRKEFKEAYQRYQSLLVLGRDRKFNHIITSQEGTKYIFDRIRDSLWFLVFGAKRNEMEYILKQDYAMPAAIGMCAYSDDDNAIGLACTPYIAAKEAAKVLARAETEMFDYNFKAAMFFRTQMHNELDQTLLQAMNIGQAKMNKIKELN